MKLFDESLQRQQQADMQLAAARKTGDYELFQQALSGYDEAMALSPDNDAASGNREKTLVEYAKQALENEEIDLAESIAAQLPKGRKSAGLTAAIAAKRDALEKRSGRQKIQRIVLLAMGVLLLIGSVAYFWRSSDIEQAIESGRRFDSIESTTLRRSAIMNLSSSLPQRVRQSLGMMEMSFDMGNPHLSDEERRRLSVQHGNRDGIMDELTEMLVPVSKACEDMNAIKSDEDVTAIYQTLQTLRPQLMEKFEEVSEMKRNSDLVTLEADTILKSLTTLTTRPERYEPPAR